LRSNYLLRFPTAGGEEEEESIILRTYEVDYILSFLAVLSFSDCPVFPKSHMNRAI